MPIACRPRRARRRRSSIAHADVLAEQVGVRRPLPRRREVDRLVAARQLPAAAERIDAGDDQALGQVHHGAVVAVRLVQLQHREFGVVLGADALVAEDPADLVDLLDAADQQPLQVQFQGDAQEQVDVERVVVRDERPRRGAAGDGVQRRRLDLAVALRRRGSCGCVRTILTRLQGPVERLRACRSGRGSGAAAETPCPACRPTCPGAAPATCRGTSACRRRWSARPSSSCRSVPSTPIRSPRSSFCASAQPCLADLLLADHDLQGVAFLALVVGESAWSSPRCRGSRALPWPRAGDDAAGGADLGPFAVRLVGRQGQDVADGLMAVESAAPRIEPELLDPLQLVLSAGFEGFRHGGTLSFWEKMETWILVRPGWVSIEGIGKFDRRLRLSVRWRASATSR